jgi:hypothetical protein
MRPRDGHPLLCTSGGIRRRYACGFSSLHAGALLFDDENILTQPHQQVKLPRRELVEAVQLPFHNQRRLSLQRVLGKRSNGVHREQHRVV